MAFPVDADLGTVVELQIGGVWTDVTPYAYLGDPITVTHGRADQAARVDPGTCKITLKNLDGRFSPRNPLSPYYGRIGRNTPVRVSVQAGSSYLSGPGGTSGGGGVQTPDAAALDIVGDLDVRVDATLDNWVTAGIVPSVELAGKFNAGGNQRSWLLQARDGGLHLEWSADGANVTQVDSTAKLPGRRRLAVRVTLDVNNGASGSTVTFYTAASLSGTWTQLGDPIVTAGVTSIFNGTAPLRVGRASDLTFTNPDGQLWGAEVRNGIGGTIVASPDFRPQTPGATSFTDGTGKVWTVQAGSSLSNKRVRLSGEVANWPVSWGNGAGMDVRTSVAGAGILRRLGQGSTPLQSTLRRRIPSFSPLGYWPMEEPAGATQAYSPIKGVRPMIVSGLTFAADSSLPGSAALPTIGSATSVSAVPLSGTGTWQIEFVYKIPVAPAGDANSQFLVVNSGGTGRTWRIGIGATNLHVDVTDQDGNLVGALASIPTNFFGTWNRFQLMCSQSGTNVSWNVRWITIGGGGFVIGDVFAGTAGPVTSIRTLWSSTLSGMSVGHLAVFGTQSDYPFTSADQGFNGDTAGNRLARLASEESIPLTIYGNVAAQGRMGPQLPAAILDLLSDAADADGGILYERRNALGLAYRDLDSLYNQPVGLALDYTAKGNVAPPLQPVDDDQGIKNDITVTRVNGSSARVTLDVGALSTQAPPNGVGPYAGNPVTLNLFSDDQPEQQAGWRLHLGTWDEARYPSVHVNLAKAPGLIDAATALDSGDLISVTHLPAWLPPDDLLLMVQGYTETIGLRAWDITYNATPGGPWSTIGVADDPLLGRAGTDGGSLAAAATSTATTLSIATTSGPLWTADPTDTPFDIKVGGEVVTVTTVGTVLNGNSDFESGISGWGVNAAGALTWSTAQAHTGTHSALLTANGGSNPRFEDTKAPVTAGQQYRVVGWVYAPAAPPSTVGINVNWYDAANAFLSTSSNNVTPTVGGWQLYDATFTAPVNATQAGILLSVTGTPAAGLQVWGDDIKLVPVSTYNASPQTMTVTRSVNGISKAQASGTDVTLAHPAYTAL